MLYDTKVSLPGISLQITEEDGNFICINNKTHRHNDYSNSWDFGRWEKNSGDTRLFLGPLQLTDWSS